MSPQNCIATEKYSFLDKFSAFDCSAFKPINDIECSD